MRCEHCTVCCQFQQSGGKPDVQPLKDNIVYQRKEIRYPAGIRPEHKLAKERRPSCQIIECRPRNSDGADIGFRHAICRVIFERQHAGGCEHTAFTGMDPVEKNFPPGFRLLLNTNGAAEQEKQVVGGLAGAEYLRPRRNGYDNAAFRKVIANAGWQLLEPFKILDPVSRFGHCITLFPHVVRYTD